MAELHLRDLARKLLIEHEWDLTAARDGLGAMLSRDYVKAHIENYVREAMLNAMSEIWRAQRSTRYGRATPVAAKGEVSDSSALGEIYREITKDWYNWPLEPKSGTSLGDATRPQLLSAVSMWEKQVRAQQADIEWVRLIAARLRDDATPVREAFTEQELGDLKARIEVGALVGD